MTDLEEFIRYCERTQGNDPFAHDALTHLLALKAKVDLLDECETALKRALSCGLHSEGASGEFSNVEPMSRSEKRAIEVEDQTNTVLVKIKAAKGQPRNDYLADDYAKKMFEQSGVDPNAPLVEEGKP